MSEHAERPQAVKVHQSSVEIVGKGLVVPVMIALVGLYLRGRLDRASPEQECYDLEALSWPAFSRLGGTCWSG